MSHDAPATRGETTQILQDWGRGDREAADRLFPRVYDELRSLARRQLRRGARADTLRTTALVHEVYLKLVDPDRVALRDRQHFFALASRAMRQILVDHARRRTAQKRGGGIRPTTLDEGRMGAEVEAVELMALDEALGRLEELDPRLVRLVELRFFAGLTVEEAAELLEVSTRTLRRDWAKARAFLYREMTRQ